MRFVLLAIQMLLLVLPAIAEDPLSRFIDPASIQKLRAGEAVRSRVAPGASLALIPAVSSRQGIAADFVALRPDVAIEVLQLIPGSSDATGAGQWLRIYNALHAVSTMKGIPYYSVSRGKEQVLFTQSYAIASADKPVRIDDPVFEAIPADGVLLTLQEDGSFGRNTYQESFQYREDHLVVKIENLTSISFLFVPLMLPRNLVSHVVLIPVGPDLLFYGLGYLHSNVPVSDRPHREESLANRLIAVANWLHARLATVGSS
jgi:hypothetical protein